MKRALFALFVVATIAFCTSAAEAQKGQKILAVHIALCGQNLEDTVEHADFEFNKVVGAIISARSFRLIQKVEEGKYSLELKGVTAVERISSSIDMPEEEADDFVVDLASWPSFIVYEEVSDKKGGTHTYMTIYSKKDFVGNKKFKAYLIIMPRIEITERLK